MSMTETKADKAVLAAATAVENDQFFQSLGLSVDYGAALIDTSSSPETRKEILAIVTAKLNDLSDPVRLASLQKNIVSTYFVEAGLSVLHMHSITALEISAAVQVNPATDPERRRFIQRAADILSLLSPSED